MSYFVDLATHFAVQSFGLSSFVTLQTLEITKNVAESKQSLRLNQLNAALLIFLC